MIGKSAIFAFAAVVACGPALASPYESADVPEGRKQVVVEKVKVKKVPPMRHVTVPNHKVVEVDRMPVRKTKSL